MAHTHRPTFQGDALPKMCELHPKISTMPRPLLTTMTDAGVVVVVEILFRIVDQTGRFAQYYDGDIIREVNSKEMKCLVHVVYHQ